MAPSPADLKALFLHALERPAGPERAAYLEEACRDQPALRAELDELLAAHDRAGGFLGSAAETAARNPAPAQAPTLAGQEIATGAAASSQESTAGTATVAPTGAGDPGVRAAQSPRPRSPTPHRGARH